MVLTAVTVKGAAVALVLPIVAQVPTVEYAPDVEMNVLEALAENVRKLAGARIQVVREILGEPSPLSLRDSTALVQIGQEAISNAVEHGSPSVITISCHYEARSVNLTISDNGFGFQSGSDAAGFGILGMQRRARELGGVLEISSTPGLGTRVSVKMKLHRSTIVTRSIWYAKSKLRGFRAVTDS